MTSLMRSLNEAWF